jgi:Recombination endonuclease VII
MAEGTFNSVTYQKEWRAANREKCKGYSKKYYAKIRSDPTKMQHRAEQVRGYKRRTFIGLDFEGVCGICGCRETQISNTKYRKSNQLCADHNHVTGKVRGALCSSCNTAIGKLKVDEKGIDLLLAAISYIKKTDGV